MSAGCPSSSWIPASLASVSAGSVQVKGPHGELSLRPHPDVNVAYNDEAREIVVTRESDDREHRALHGLTRALIANVVKSVDKHACGQFAANVRAVRPVEPYKGKGIRYSNEQVRRKAGKAFAGS